MEQSSEQADQAMWHVVHLQRSHQQDQARPRKRREQSKKDIPILHCPKTPLFSPCLRSFRPKIKLATSQPKNLPNPLPGVKKEFPLPKMDALVCVCVEIRLGCFPFPVLLKKRRKTFGAILNLNGV